MKLRIKKLPILLPLLLVAVALIAAAVMARLSWDSAAAHTDLGQKYLNDMDYTGAVTEFLKSLSMDPTDQEARLGLAEAYAASGSAEIVPEILEPLTEAQSPEACRLLIESLRGSDLHRALLVAQELAEHTDSDEDYALRDELLGQVLLEAHTYAVGEDQRLMVDEGAVLSSGSNTFGQLGTGQGLATEAVQDGFQSAQFSGQAARVYCAGRTSYVVDQSGNLWAAGENRWGQLGMDYASADPQSGWFQIVDSGDVAAVAGTVGMLYVLKTDGSLWYAGQGGVMELRQIRDFGEVAAVESGERQTAVLTADGLLYVSDTEDPLRWTRQASGVKLFCFGGSGLVWVTAENQIGFSASVPQLPDTWAQNGGSTTPDFVVCDIAADSDGLLLLDAAGQLHRVYNGQVTEVDGLTAVNIYSTGGTVVVEQEGGGAMLWTLSAPTPTAAA